MVLGTPTFRLKKDKLQSDGTIEPGFIPLQDADLLAHEYFQVWRAALEGDKSKGNNWAFQNFHRVPGSLKVVTNESTDYLIEHIKAAAETMHLEL